LRCRSNESRPPSAMLHCYYRAKNQRTSDVRLAKALQGRLCKIGRELDLPHVKVRRSTYGNTVAAPLCYIITSVIFLVWGLATLVWTPFHVFMIERLRMTPGFPPYEWWKNPPDEVLIRAYVFNVTNVEEFLNNTDTKLNMEEIGPIVFR
jgi:hypothetical protein